MKHLPLTIKVVKVNPDFNFDRYLQLFTPQVIDSIYSYRFPKDQIVKFCSELLKHYYLADLLQKNPSNLDIIYNKYNKPFLVSRDFLINPKQVATASTFLQSLHVKNDAMCFNSGDHNIKFNISHAQEYVIIAVIDNPAYEVGVDIEYIDRNSNDFREMAKIVYSDFEISQIKNVDDFFNFWTKKESLIKARGTGFGEDFYKTTQLTLDNYIQTTDHVIYTTLFERKYYISICLYKAYACVSYTQ